jgi:hypothetical protein
MFGVSGDCRKPLSLQRREQGGQGEEMRAERCWERELRKGSEQGRDVAALRCSQLSLADCGDQMGAGSPRRGLSQWSRQYMRWTHHSGQWPE